MKKFILFGLLITLLLTVNVACRSFQAGITIDPMPDGIDDTKSAFGLSFATDLGKYFEYSMHIYPYIPEPDQYRFGIEAEGPGFGLGMDLNFFYPFHFYGNQFSIFPIVGGGVRFYDFPKEPTYNYDYYDPWDDPYYYQTEPTMFDEPRFHIHFGGGVDIAFSPKYYIRGKILYQPPALSMEDEWGNPIEDFRAADGLRYYLTVGYRTKGSTVRRGYKSSETLRIEQHQKDARENFDKKRYNASINAYKSLINMGAPLGNNGVANLATAYYERGKEYSGRNNHRLALADYNSSFQHRYAMSTQVYEEWKDTIKKLESGGRRPSVADLGKHAKLVAVEDSNITITYERSANGQTSNYEILGTGRVYSLEAGRRTFSLTYDETRSNNGFRKASAVPVTINMEAGRIYKVITTANDSNMQVSITIMDVTESELGRGENINTNPLFSHRTGFRDERPAPQSVTFSLVNNTGYTLTHAAIVRSDLQKYQDSDWIGFNLQGDLPTGTTRRITTPAMDIHRDYFMFLTDNEGDFYVKGPLRIANNSTITVVLADIYIE